MRTSAVASSELGVERLQTAPCRSVLMIGTDLAGKGGIRAVVQGYLDGGLFERFPGEYIATHRYGSTWTKLTAAIGGWWRVARALRRLDAPLLHAQMASRASFWRKSVACLMARAAGRPYLVHLHGGEFVQFYQHESGALRRRYIRHILANAALVIAVSEIWRERVLKICPAAKVEVLTNAVALPDPSRRHAGLARADGAPTVLFLGDLNRGKGAFDLVRAFAQIAPRSPHLRLVFGGVGEVAEVRQLAQELGVAARVDCAGWLDSEHKHAALATATLFVLPSYAEGMPMALLEALSWGIPAIATAVGGVPQVVADERNGLLIAAGDIDGLAAAMSRLMSDPALRERLGAAGRETVQSGFALEATLARLAQIYRRFGIAARA
jgi:glycosyltransferase involved in cell wall biosynthesis